MKYMWATWRLEVMVIMMIDYPAASGLLSTEEDLTIPFSDPIKYCILGICITLFLLALFVLAWQVFRCLTQKHALYTAQNNASSDPLYLDDKLTTEDDYLEGPSIKVNGSLRFSLYYDEPQSRLVVTVLQVAGLQDHSQIHSLQSFVKLRLMRAGSNGNQVNERVNEEADGMTRVLWRVLDEWQTHTVKGSTNPLFGEQFSYILQEEKELHHITLRMEVRDFDRFSRPTVLGEVRVPLSQLNIVYPVELQQDLQTPQKDLVGEVLLSLKFLPTSQRLEIGILKIRTLLSGVSSDAALYTRVSVQCNQCKLRYQKTTTVSRCPVTVFNEVLMFTLPEFPVEQCRIVVSVYETQVTNKSSKHLIGQLTVEKEKSSEDKHWNLMMRSVRQPVAKWRSLLI
ncbi:synaptotagmin-2 [Thalassophryne amazonica]|uniref:synaptotagmin-2 n=1 Tax=Thalassophryne amazonica TaxID=390379 RepID=UPI00147120DA|nr:synaptotagmin-2 [Thalassophryne amazonica]